MSPCAYDGQALFMISHMHDELHEKQLVCNLNEQMITPIKQVLPSVKVSCICHHVCVVDIARTFLAHCFFHS
jgi:hypothetical protein